MKLELYEHFLLAKSKRLPAACCWTRRAVTKIHFQFKLNPANVSYCSYFSQLLIFLCFSHHSYPFTGVTTNSEIESIDNLRSTRKRRQLLNIQYDEAEEDDEVEEGENEGFLPLMSRLSKKKFLIVL